MVRGLMIAVVCVMRLAGLTLSQNFEMFLGPERRRASEGSFPEQSCM